MMAENPPSEQHSEPYVFLCRTCKEMSDLDDPTDFRCPRCGSEIGVWGPRRLLAPRQE